MIERRDVTATLAVFRFALEGGVPDFEPGQFLLLGLHESAAKPIWRAYSIASPPETRDHVELFVRLVTQPASGHLTPRLWRLECGDQVLYKRPRGAFSIPGKAPDRSADPRDLLLMAGGTGIAPFLSAVRHLHHVGTDRRIVLCHGARHVPELVYRELLGELEAQSLAEPHGSWWFRYLPTISRPAESVGWSGCTGRVETLLERRGDERSRVEVALERGLGPGDTSIYVCGFDGTVTAVLEAVESLGFRSREHPHADGSWDVYSESFG